MKETTGWKELLHQLLLFLRSSTDKNALVVLFIINEAEQFNRAIKAHYFNISVLYITYILATQPYHL